jgi:hypothetical protein
MLGVVLELLVVEKDLLARCKNKFGAAVRALQYSIMEFHVGRLPSNGDNHRNRPSWNACPVPDPSLVLETSQGPDRLKSERYKYCLQCKEG